MFKLNAPLLGRSCTRISKKRTHEITRRIRSLVPDRRSLCDWRGEVAKAAVERGVVKLGPLSNKALSTSSPWRPVDNLLPKPRALGTPNAQACASPAIALRRPAYRDLVLLDDVAHQVLEPLGDGLPEELRRHRAIDFTRVRGR